MAKLSENEKIQLIYNAIKKVTPEKLLNEFNVGTSIINDLALDSIEIMDLLIEIQDQVNEKYHINDNANVDRLLSYLFSENDDLSVGSLCEFIDNL